MRAQKAFSPADLTDTLVDTTLAPARSTSRPICDVCAVGDCATRACLRVACFHECPGARWVGVSALGDAPPKGAGQ